MPRLPEGTRVSSRDRKKRQGTFALTTDHPLDGFFIVPVNNSNATSDGLVIAHTTAYIGQYADYGDFLPSSDDTDFDPNDY